MRAVWCTKSWFQKSYASLHVLLPEVNVLVGVALIAMHLLAPPDSCNMWLLSLSKSYRQECQPRAIHGCQMIETSAGHSLHVNMMLGTMHMYLHIYYKHHCAYGYGYTFPLIKYS